MYIHCTDKIKKIRSSIKKRDNVLHVGRCDMRTRSKSSTNNWFVGFALDEHLTIKSHFSGNNKQV